MTDNDDVNYPWVEEFRPTKIEDVIGAREHLVTKINEYLTSKSLPHLLFCGGPGTGKTTIAKILANNICGKGNYLYINASDRNNIDTIRTDVINYCGTLGFNDNLKIVILDECDGLLSQSQKALRSVMEEYKKTRFILTCNYNNKIIDPIKSRCQIFDFFGANQSQIAMRCINILKKKNVKIDKDNIEKIKSDITKLVSTYYPDIRSTINNLQKFTHNNEFKFDINSTKDEIKNKFIELLKKRNIKSIREEILNQFVDYLALYDTIFENAKELTSDPDKIGSIYVTLADYMYKHSTHLNQELNFVACLIEIVGIVR